MNCNTNSLIGIKDSVSWALWDVNVAGEGGGEEGGKTEQDKLHFL